MTENINAESEHELTSDVKQNQASKIEKKQGNQTNLIPADNVELSQDQALSFVLHQDNLMWSRIQTMQAVQLAGLGGCYALRDTVWLAISILFLGAMLTVLVFCILKRDQLIRDKLLPASKLDWRVPLTWYAPITGTQVTWMILIVLLLADMVLGFSVVGGIV